jgi:hypothetical protein
LLLELGARRQFGREPLRYGRGLQQYRGFASRLNNENRGHFAGRDKL